MKKFFFLATLILCINAALAWGVQYTVLYLDLAQTITAQHTFNPSTASTAPFAIGSNASEVEVVDLRAEKATAFASNPTNCTTANTFPAGVDASGNVESCTSATAADTDYFPYPGTGRISYCAYPGSGTALSCVGEIYATTGTASASAASDTQPASVNHTTTTNNAEFGASGTNAIYRAGAVDITIQINAGNQETTSTKRVWIGLTSETTTNQLASDTPTADYAAFRYSSGTESTWQCVTGDGVSQTVTNTGTSVDTTSHTFDIRLDVTANTAKFYIDGTLKCTHTSSNNLPGSVAHANMRFISRGKNLTGGGTATGLRNGYAFVVSDR